MLKALGPPSFPLILSDFHPSQEEDCHQRSIESSKDMAVGTKTVWPQATMLYLNCAQEYLGWDM